MTFKLQFTLPLFCAALLPAADPVPAFRNGARIPVSYTHLTLPTIYSV